MDSYTRERAFEPFFTTKGPGKGTGLGLSTVYGIVTQNQGEIHLSSELGRGTIFDLYFPQESGSEIRNEVPPPGQDRRRSPATILIVEDEPAVRGLVKQTLEGFGYSVLEAGDGYEALRVIEDSPRQIDLVLTDVIMPLMDGHELATRLRLLRPQTKVIFMSGYADDVLAFHGISQPEIVLIQKPFTVMELEGKVAMALSANHN
jgi:CheY-like chemotaxis protein